MRTGDQEKADKIKDKLIADVKERVTSIKHIKGKNLIHDFL